MNYTNLILQKIKLEVKKNKLLYWCARHIIQLLNPKRFITYFYYKYFPIVLFCFTILFYPVLFLISWLRIGIKKLLHLKPSIVWGPSPIINIVDNSAIMNSLGYKSRTIVYTVYHITKEFDYNLKTFIEDKKTGILVPHIAFIWTFLSYDVFHFFYDYGFWSGMNIFPAAKWVELPLLRIAGKRIIISAYGSDVRVRAINERWPVNICQECPEPGRYCICDAGKAERNVAYQHDWANVCLAMGDMHDYVDGSRVDFNYWPVNAEEVTDAGISEHPGPIRIVHSPNHRYFKGTGFIEASVGQLQQEGFNIELVIVEGVSNDVARQAYATADVVAAQCLAGWVGYTEIEAMAMGKPVISYIRAPERYLGHTVGCPVVNATPETLTDKMRELVSNIELRKELGMRGRDYVEREWSYQALAPRYAELHQQVWSENRLWALLDRKVRESLHKEQIA